MADAFDAYMRYKEFADRKRVNDTIVRGNQINNEIADKTMQDQIQRAKLANEAMMANTQILRNQNDVFQNTRQAQYQAPVIANRQNQAAAIAQENTNRTFDRTLEDDLASSRADRIYKQAMAQDAQIKTAMAQQKQQMEMLNIGSNLAKRAMETYPENPERWAPMIQSLGVSDNIMPKSWGNLTPERVRELANFTGGRQPEYEQVKGVPGLSFDKANNRYIANDEIMQQAAQYKAKGEKVGLTPKDIAGINDKVTPMISNAQEVKQSARALQSLNKNSSASDQLAAIFAFMKSLDPTSVVRETEQGMLLATGGVADGMVAYYNKLMGEGALSPNVFEQMVNTANNLASVRIDNTREEIQRYLDVNKDYLPPSQYEAMKNRVPSFGDQEADNFKGKSIEGSAVGSGVTDGIIIENDAGERYQSVGGKWQKI